MIETPFNYTGSKYRLLDQLLPEFDYGKKFFVDLFSGGGSVYTNVLDKYERVLVNDIIKELVGIHKGLLESDDIIEKTKSLCPSKDDQESFLKLRESFNQEKSPEKLWSLMLSSTNNMMRFNQKFLYNQTFGKRSCNDNTQKKVDIFTEHVRKYKDRLFFTSQTFNDIKINRPLDTFVYVDPPYSNTEAGYNSYWKKDDDKKLYDYCVNLNDSGGSFCVSGVLSHDGENCVLLDLLIKKGFQYKELDFDYNKVSRKGKKETTEIIIKNY